jgi:hypothetical protein
VLNIYNNTRQLGFNVKGLQYHLLGSRGLLAGQNFGASHDPDSKGRVEPQRGDLFSLS